MAEEAPELYVRYFKGLKALESALAEPYEGERRVALFWGTTGTGKTRAVFDAFPREKTFTCPDVRVPWFDGYEGQEVVLLDEMGTDSMCINVLKRLTDRYPQQVPVKGSMLPWMAKTVILTANTHYSGWWPKARHADYEALERRMRVFEFPKERQQALTWLAEDPLATKDPRQVYDVPSESEPEEDQNSDDEWGRVMAQAAIHEVLDLSQ